ncbi:MAG: NAD(P)/FAD-dependent oxidoreductase [Symploca sp. SIO3C6]|uniref:NAD(P)/FAD-dependent oxidoreductase n=1 Tax=Symploca sp. SIO1C4 TaxID=2607765 RepID=A0A6B3ND10_9CYAN|nr:NAD(P)/FAD-dependent oxidoreductase [Symploca sp. SIO3C6]NER31446.1 NAD(P)/FAD-dependent oxidoreductase [Symploca sp. SIO1C4]
MSTSTVSQSLDSGHTHDFAPANKSLYHQIVIVGGGAAGITTASQLLTKDQSLDIAIIEPSAQHYYQPGWTLVGGGVFKLEDTLRREEDCLPKGTTWIKDYVTQLDPDHNALVTSEGKRVEYEYLILSPGIQIDWHLIKGLKEALGKEGVTSIYSKDYAPYTWEVINNFQGGTAIFTFPSTPIKCGGAPQKIMYMADDIFKGKSGVGTNSQVIFGTATAKMFPVPEYCDSLEKVVKRRNIQVNFKHNLKEIKAESKEAVFDVTTDEGVQEVSIKYDMIHVTPPMSAPDFVKNSPLAIQEGASKGWVDVNKQTLQHHVYANVFSLGDASSLPTSKTAAAIRKQAPVLVENLLALKASKTLNSQYNGYTCCPLITGYNHVVMAEFDYDNKLASSFPFDPSKERYSMWLLKRHVFPWLYWNRMLKGKLFEGDRLNFLKKN